MGELRKRRPWSQEEFSTEMEGVKVEPEKEIGEKIESIFDRYKKKLEGVDFQKALQLIKRELVPKIPEIETDSLEKVINGFIRTYAKSTIEGWDRDKKLQYYPRELGLFISQIINKTVKGYVEEQLRKGMEVKEIKPLITKIDAKIRKPTEENDRARNLARIDNLGFKNPEKSHLSIVGPCGNYVGREMKGGEVHVYGAVRKNIGKKMKGGKLFLYSGVIDEKFDPAAFSERNKGTIYRMKGQELEQVWPKEEKEKNRKIK